MDQALVSLLAASLAFVGMHFALSHPLRGPLVGALGENGFRALYSLVALATFVWAAMAFRAVGPGGVPLWNGSGDALWAIATVIMLIASVLLAGSFQRNPALPDPRAAAHAAGLGRFGRHQHPQRHDRQKIPHDKELKDQEAEQPRQQLPVRQFMLPIEQQHRQEGAQLGGKGGHQRHGDEHRRRRPAQTHVMIAVGPAGDDGDDLARGMGLRLCHGGGHERMVGLGQMKLHHQSPDAPPPPKLPPPEKPPPPQPPPLPQPEPPEPDPQPDPSPGPQMTTGALPPRR